jgi:ClpX C4-type zinc finger
VSSTLDKMGLGQNRLEDARRHRARMLDAIHEADLARADFEHAVRRLHAAGATLREIASALELSHQRVHQIVDDGSPRRRRRDRARAVGSELLCSFCGRNEVAVGRLVAGPGVFICAPCVDLAVEAGTSGESVADGRIRLTPLPTGAPDPCRFCGKTSSLVAYVVARADARACSECLVLCREILAEGPGPPRPT